jgi:transcriptional regulator with XRE-family HTH domain
MTTSVLRAEKWVPKLTFSARLALVRHDMGWNIKEAAVECDVRPQSWRGWEIERRLPHDIRQVCRKIATRTGVDYHWLLDGADEHREQPSNADTLRNPQRAVRLRQMAVWGMGSALGSARPIDTRPSGRPWMGDSGPGMVRPARLPRPSAA